VRGNEIHHIFNGIYTGVSGTAGENPAIAFDADIYNNRIHDIADDGDRSNDFIRFYSGNYNSGASHPILQVEYYVP
jgi:hypothetical protein